MFKYVLKDKEEGNTGKNRVMFFMKLLLNIWVKFIEQIYMFSAL
jgi:hypothetical protein